MLKSMTAIAITAPGGPDVLVPRQRPIPTPAPNQVLIKVAYGGVNRHDCGQRQRGQPPHGATDIPGLEIAGTIVHVGAGVSRWREGDEVCALVNGGGYAQYCVADAPLLLPIPNGFDLQQAAMLPEAMFTVWLNLFEIGRLRAGDWCLVHGGASGVGTIAIQVARALGINVMATAGSDAKATLCTQLGAQAVCNYQREDFVTMVADATNGHGADVILDMAGGGYAERNLRAVATDGRIVHLTAAGEPRYNVPLALIMQKRAIITGAMLRAYPLERKAWLASELLRTVWPMLGSTIHPVLDSVFPLDDARGAHVRIESGEHAGKILLAT